MPRLKFIVAGSLILGAFAYLMLSGISESMVYYYTITETTDRASELSGKGIRISGFVSPGTIDRDQGQSRVEFVVFEKSSDRTLPVTYQGIIPDTFKDNAEVVVEGLYYPQETMFRATTLLAKCPSKYEGLADEDSKDIALKEQIK